MQCYDVSTRSIHPVFVDLQDGSSARQSGRISRANCPIFSGAATGEKVAIALLPQVYRTIVQDDRHGATLDDIEHTISSAVIDSVVRKS